MQKTKAAGNDAFVTRLSPAGAIVASTYWGGNDDDEALDVALDGVGSVYITGDTFSTDFPRFGTSHGGPAGNNTFTAFYTKIVPQLSIAVHSVTFGGGFDQGNSIALDAFGNIFIAGSTLSPTFPTTPGAFQQNKPSTGALSQDAFVVELNSASNLQFATYLGGSDGGTAGDSIAVNSIGQVYVSGATASTDFPGGKPLTPNPTAGYLVKFNPALASLNFRIFLGAEVKSIAIPAPARRRFFLPPIALTPTQIYTTGFRFRPGSDVSDQANTDAFVVKVDDSLVLAPVFAK